MIWMSRRRMRSSPASSDLTLLPSKWISPEVGSIRRSTQRPVVDLPQPDSPTSPRVSPRSMWKSIPSTAWTLPAWRPNKPPLSGKFLVRFQTLSNGSLIEQPSLPHGYTQPCDPVLVRARPVVCACIDLSQSCNAVRSGSPPAGLLTPAPCRRSSGGGFCGRPPYRCAGSSGSSPGYRDGGDLQTTARPTPPPRPCPHTSPRRAGRPPRRHPWHG